MNNDHVFAAFRSLPAIQVAISLYARRQIRNEAVFGCREGVSHCYLVGSNRDLPGGGVCLTDQRVSHL